MERESGESRHGRERPPAGIEELGSDDQEFAAVEDVGSPPSENASVDDV